MVIFTLAFLLSAWVLTILLIFYRMVKHELLIIELIDLDKYILRFKMPDPEDFVFGHWDKWTTKSWIKYLERKHKNGK